MLARLDRTVPVGPFAYEPKWDGFRCLAFRDGASLDLRSRHDRPLARYFPELVAALTSIAESRFVLDGEIVLAGPDGFDFATLMGRLHPAASRVERLAREAPAAYVAFDLLAAGDEDLRPAPFEERRRRLERLLTPRPPRVELTPTTRDPSEAEAWLSGFAGGGVDGIVAKPLDGRYEAGRRTMVKVKPLKTADCVLAGVRLLPGGSAVSSLLLGLYDDRDRLRHVGVVTQLPSQARRALRAELAADEVPIEEHPWRQGFEIERSPLGRLLGSASRWTPEMGLDWLPLAPRRVVEVGYDQVDRDRFRHPARFVRWRPDREPRSCRLDQIEVSRDALRSAIALAEDRSAA
jgi:ATP-dependent DNA ligase